MRCGTRRFLAELIINGKTETKTIIARTPPEARKLIRKNFGKDTTILSVIEMKSEP